MPDAPAPPPTPPDALHRAHALSAHAAARGFDWPEASAVRRKVDEELAELDAAVAAGDHDHALSELGDVLFTLVNLARHLGGTGAEALARTNAKFERRFQAVAALLERASEGGDDAPAPEALEAAWDAAKAEERC